MKKHLLRAALAAIVTTLAAQGALAQGSTMDNMGSGRLISFGLGGGVAVPVNNARNALKDGFAGQGFVRLNLKALPISPRVDFTFSKFNFDDAKATPPGGPPTTMPTGTSQMLSGLANLQFPLFRAGPIRPYIMAGVGAYNVKVEQDAMGSTAATSDSKTHFGINGGGGVMFKLGSMVSGFIEGHVDNVYSDKGAITKDQIQIVPVTFGLVF